MTATLAISDPDGITDAFEELLLTYHWQVADDPNGPWTDVACGPEVRSFTPGPEKWASTSACTWSSPMMAALPKSATRTYV